MFLLAILLQQHPVKSAEILAAYEGVNMPGVSAAVYRRGSIAWEGAVGAANVARGEFNAPNTRFAIQSTSKQFTAACVALLVRDGKLSWKDDVRNFIPELKRRPWAITLDHLAHHTSGLMDVTLLLQLQGVDVHGKVGFGKVLQTLNAVPLSFEPGSEWSYTNSGYILLGEVVRRVAKMPFATFAKTRLFAPLQMNDTSFDMPKDRAAMGYRARGTGFEPSPDETTLLGADGVWTTVRDLARWDRAFYEKKVPPSLLTRGVLNNGFPTCYARGVFIGSFRGHTAYRHDGGDDGYAAEYVRVPSLGASVAVLANRGDVPTTGLAGSLFLEWFGDLAPAPARAKVVVAPEMLKAIAGTFEEERSGKVWLVSSDLRMRSIADGEQVLEATSPHTFASVRRPEFNLAFDGSKLTRKFGREMIVLKRLPTPTRVEDLSGTYAGVDLPIRLEVKMTSRGLQARFPAATVWTEFLPLKGNYFMGEYSSLRRLPTGELSFEHMRARGLRFRKVATRR